MNSLLLNEPPLILLPSLALAIGLKEAVFLQQLHYWLQKSYHIHNEKKWIYRSLSEWKSEFPFWSESTIKRIILSLKKREILLVRKRSFYTFYSINWGEFQKILVKNGIGQVEQKGVQSEILQTQNEPQKARIELRKVQNEPQKNQIEPKKSQNELQKVQFEPSLIYNENQRDYTENTKEITTETTAESTQRGVAHAWNRFAGENSLPQISSLTPERVQRLDARLRESSNFLEQFQKALEEIKNSRYLLGAKGWHVTFDWLIKKENILKVLEGNYRDKSPYANSSLNNLPKEYILEDW